MTIGHRDAGTWESDPRKIIWGPTCYFDPHIFLEKNIFWYTDRLILSKIIIKIVATS